MTEQCSQFQITLLGSGGVGKSSILQRYLFGKYSDVYTETVEETYIQPYNINGRYHYINYIDTAGSISFPAMRQIYISKSNGFILVYSVTDTKSFDEMKTLWEQIKVTRENVLNIPCVIIGTHLDNENVREIETFDALNWAYSENLGGCFLEVCAQDGKGIKDIFDILLEQLGNTRAEQTGPFRIRSTSFTRKEQDAKNTQQNGKQKQRCFEKNKAKSYDHVTSSNKCFQEMAFEDYKEANIYRITPHRKYSRSVSLDSNDQEETQLCCLPTGLKNSTPMCKLFIDNINNKMNEAIPSINLETDNALVTLKESSFKKKYRLVDLYRMLKRLGNKSRT